MVIQFVGDTRKARAIGSFQSLHACTQWRQTMLGRVEQNAARLAV